MGVVEEEAEAGPEAGAEEADAVGSGVEAEAMAEEDVVGLVAVEGVVEAEEVVAAAVACKSSAARRAAPRC